VLRRRPFRPEIRSVVPMLAGLLAGTPLGWTSPAADASAAALPAVVVAEAGAQEPDEPPRLFPDRTSFPPLLAAPREVSLRGGFVVANRDVEPGADGPEGFGDFGGSNIEAEVALGHRLGVFRIRRETSRAPEVTLGFEVGVFTRFFMEAPERDLINADFRVGAPLAARWGAWEGRLTLLHVSSHFGDDFVNRFGPPPGQTTRDGFELVVARRLVGLAPALRVYGAGEWNFHVNRGVERTAGRLGVEWDGRPGAGADGAPGGGNPAGPSPDRDGDGDGGVVTWPYAGTEIRVTSLGEGPAATGVGGLGLRVRETILRFEVRAHIGLSPIGKLGFRDERFLGVALRVEP